MNRRTDWLKIVEKMNEFLRQIVQKLFYRIEIFIKFINFKTKIN